MAASSESESLPVRYGRALWPCASGQSEHMLSQDVPTFPNGSDDLEGRIHHELRLVARDVMATLLGNDLHRVA